MILCIPFLGACDLLDRDYNPVQPQHTPPSHTEASDLREDIRTFIATAEPGDSMQVAVSGEQTETLTVTHTYSSAANETCKQFTAGHTPLLSCATPAWKTVRRF